ncbi:MAG: peptidoglycan recognition family protein [Verrucomicrobiota bacterium]|nr:N-acetylmuramoyl-L-alanine amidase [Verrucomicrobiota bacterium]MCC6823715.1 N-acetylmuramoyl-L-alanine amidase [Limisphaerales bacterium]
MNIPKSFIAPGLVSLAAVLLFAGCVSSPRLGAFTPRRGDEIVVAGHYIHTRTPVVLWTDPGGYDAYRVERRFAPFELSDWNNTQQEVKELTTPNRYNLRRAGLATNEIERVRGGGWDLPTLQRVVDQFVLHYDVCGTSRQCFNVLHDHRGLSVHFMLDLDGTIYQTLDLKERAWHATTSNHRSIGIEIANMGAYRSAGDKTLARWYAPDPDGRTRITIPERLGDGGIRTPNFVGRPARNEPVWGEIQGEVLVQYDYTPEQYRALAHLTAALCKVFPKIQCDFPRGQDGQIIPRQLADAELDNYGGVLGHYHIQKNKTDPGPALNWDYLIDFARQLMGEPSPAVFRTPGLGHARQRL